MRNMANIMKVPVNIGNRAEREQMQILYPELYRYGRADYTRLARKVLGLGIKYPKDLSITEQYIQLGQQRLWFKLLPCGDMKARNTAKHRLVVLCDCGRWIPTGRMNE